MSTCPTCPSPAGDGFGGMCDQCTAAHAERTDRNRATLAAAGHAGTPLGRALGVSPIAERIPNPAGFELTVGEWRYRLHEPVPGGSPWATSASHPDEELDMRDGWYRPAGELSTALCSFPAGPVRDAFEEAVIAG